MGEQSRTKQELLQEIAGLKERIRNLEESEGEHKKAEAALRESEGRYHSLFEGSLDGVMLTRQDGTILAANRRMCEMLDLTGGRDHPPGKGRHDGGTTKGSGPLSWNGQERVNGRGSLLHGAPMARPSRWICRVMSLPRQTAPK